jgi:hypothetical protein
MSKISQEGEGADPSRELPQERPRLLNLLRVRMVIGGRGDRRQLAGRAVKWPVRTGVGSPITSSHAGSS